MTDMIEVKTAELDGVALDWAVAKAVSRGVSVLPGGVVVRGANVEGGCPWRPSAYWSQGGPIIERFIKEGAYVKINSGCRAGFAFSDDDGIWAGSKQEFAEYGDTLLYAACRAIVAAKLGPVVSVPAELLAE